MEKLSDQWALINSHCSQKDARELETVSQTVAVKAPMQDCDAHTCATCVTLREAGWFEARDIKGQPSKRRTCWSKTCKSCETQCAVIEEEYLSIISAAIETGAVFLRAASLPPYRRGGAKLCINDQKFKVPQYVKFFPGVVPDQTEALGWHGVDGWREAILKSIWGHVDKRRPLISMCWSLSILLEPCEVFGDLCNRDSYLTVTKTEWEPALVWLRAIQRQFANTNTAPGFQEKVWFYAVYKGNNATCNHNYIEMCMHISKSTNVDDLHAEWNEFEGEITHKGGIPSKWHPQDSWVAAICIQPKSPEMYAWPIRVSR
jgi:hypothetical protein